MSYDELRAFIIDNMGRWEKIMGHSPIHAVDHDDSILLEGEDGVLFPLERKGNHWKVVPAANRKPKPSSPPTKRFAKGACYRCGRDTHRIKECQETIDVFGNPTKPKRYEQKGKAALAVDKEGEDVDQQALDIDLAALDMDDPWVNNDPWCAEKQLLPPPPASSYTRPPRLRLCKCCDQDGIYGEDSAPIEPPLPIAMSIVQGQLPHKDDRPFQFPLLRCLLVHPHV